MAEEKKGAIGIRVSDGKVVEATEEIRARITEALERGDIIACVFRMPDGNFAVQCLEEPSDELLGVFEDIVKGFKEVLADAAPEEFRKWNHYRCMKCSKVSVHRIDAKGVTPFMYHCQATRGCNGTAQSSFFKGSQADDQVADVIWWKPTPEELVEELKQYGAHTKDSVRRHVEQGGLLPRDVNPQPVKGTRH